MQDETLFPEKQESRGSDRDKLDTAFRIAHINSETKKQVHFLRINPNGNGKYYTLGGTARNMVHGYDHSNPACGFAKELEIKTLDDHTLLMILISMQKCYLETHDGGSKQNKAPLEPLLERAKKYIEGEINIRFSMSDSIHNAMQEHAKAQQQFQEFLDVLKQKLSLYRDILIAHPLFSDIDRVIEQLDAVNNICRGSRLNTSPDNEVATGGTTVELPEAYAGDFPEDLHTLNVRTHNMFSAKSLFLHHLGLVPHIKYFFTLGLLVEYAERAALRDNEVQGVYPTIVEPDENGLVLDVKEFAHPAIYRGKPLGKHFHDIYESLGRETIRMLQEDGLLDYFQDANGGRDLFWLQEVKPRSIEDFITRHGIGMGAAETLTDIFNRSAFFPFSGIHLSTRNRIQIVTGANFNGKSTYMQAVGYLFHQAATLRKLIARNARLSLPDMVFDDFDINSDRQWDIASERSTFSSQVQKIIQFMGHATPKSIGLFDELYHGTSAPYLLSLGWATLEKFDQLGLYAIISTHEPLLTRFTERDGYESLRGKYYRPPHNQSALRETSVSNVSMQGTYRLCDGPVTDSDAFRIARQEQMPEDVMRRSEEILAHITSKNGS
ncbi:hypothetical protein KJ996_00560 [Patescibacteria group bacterium]|nr:hypothetical protein [Patescibacteria group bacterium]